MTTYYKVLSRDLKSCHGGSATWIPGEWQPLIDNLDPCDVVQLVDLQSKMV